MTVQWLETHPDRSFEVAPFEVAPFKAGSFRVPTPEGPDTPYASDCVGDSWVGQFAPYVREARRWSRVEPYYFNWPGRIRPRLKQAPRSPARPATGPMSAGAGDAPYWRSALKPEAPSRTPWGGSGGCPHGYVRDRHGRCICDAYASTPCDRPGGFPAHPRLRQASSPGRQTRTILQQCPPGYKRDASGGCSKATSKEIYPGVHWMSGVGQAAEKNGTATTKEKEETHILKYAVGGIVGLVVGALFF